MGLIKKITNEFGTIVIWEITETIAELQNQINLSERDAQEFSSITAERRKKEFLATRILLEGALGIKMQIDYNDSGKPYLKNTGLNISISHSAEYVTLFLSKMKVGIDIENTHRNISRIAGRFLSEKEKICIKQTKKPDLALFIYWGAKESIFKCSPEKNIQFNQQISVDRFGIKAKGEFTGQLRINRVITNYKLFYFFLKNNVLVYCVEQ